MGYIIQRKSLITFTLALFIAFFSLLPASAAEVQPRDFYDQSPKYVEIVKQYYFDDGGQNFSPPMSYYYVTYFPAGRFVGYLQLRNPWYTVGGQSGYHEVTYTGYVYFNP